MKNKKFITYLLLGTTLLSAIPAVAYKDSVGSFTTENIESNATSNTTVYAEIGSEFKVIIPKHIILDGTEKKGEYLVTVEGDIAGLEYVSVVPDKNITLSSANLASVVAPITQDKTAWFYDEILPETKVIGNGLIDAKDITAGSWNGNFNFNISLNEEVYAVGLMACYEEDEVPIGTNIDSEKINVELVLSNDKKEAIETYTINGLNENSIVNQEGSNTWQVSYTSEDNTEYTTTLDVWGYAEKKIVAEYIGSDVTVGKPFSSTNVTVNLIFTEHRDGTTHSTIIPVDAWSITNAEGKASPIVLNEGINIFTVKYVSNTGDMFTDTIEINGIQ